MTVANIVLFALGFIIPSPANWLWRKLSKIDPIVYSHYKLRAMRRGHAPNNPLACHDGDCKLITK